MDRSSLLNYYMTHYVSRREVLFKLPLTIPIESFWPELLARRRSRAVTLPLRDAEGIPYWYVLTDAMIDAGEKITEMARKEPDAIDPYRAVITDGLMDEMFFTSFIEGAQINRQQAKDFLWSGREPEDVSEQMLQNNRNAISMLLTQLGHSANEERIRLLAFTLTNEMEGCTGDYRQTDDPEIAAMDGEACPIIPAERIGERISTLCSYIDAPDVHPLIKAGVGQAFVLIARPFPEGNERLARLLSYGVLLRSGYDFFRQFSISGLIAQESYLYFNAMKDVLRSENGGDLTYFLEFFLRTLAKGVALYDGYLLAREREIARQPVGKAVQDPARDNAASFASGSDTKQPDPKPTTLQPPSATAATPTSQLPSAATSPAVPGKRASDEPLVIPPRLRKTMEQLRQSNSKYDARRYKGLTMLLERRKYELQSQYWSDMLGLEGSSALGDLRWLTEHGMMERFGNTSKTMFRLILDENIPQTVKAVCAPKYIPLSQIKENAAAHLVQFQRRIGMGTIASREWRAAFKIGKSTAAREICYLIEAGYMQKEGVGSSIRYRSIQYVPGVITEAAPATPSADSPTAGHALDLFQPTALPESAPATAMQTQKADLRYQPVELLTAAVV